MNNSFFCDPPSSSRQSERRANPDRRQGTALRHLFSSRPRRRKSPGRRRTDQAAYVDIYDFRTWSIAIAVLILSVLDGVFTRMHLVRGSAEEWNPLMRTVIEGAGMPAFFFIKLAMTVIPMGVIVIHKEWVFGRYAARLCLWAYILLSCYHLFLIFLIGSGAMG